MGASLDEYLKSARRHAFKDLLGHERWFEGLTRRITDKGSELSHQPIALIGPPGVGKMTLAKMFAQALVCEKHPGIGVRVDGNPCGVCDECRAILCSSLAYAETDARDVSNDAANKAADKATQKRKVRTLIEGEGGLNTAAVRVVVFNNAEEFTPSAADIALKTLEDEVSTTVYIFAVNEVERFSAALRSRCSVFRVGPIRTEDLVARLSLVCERASVVFDEFAIRAIAVASEGSYGAALEILKRVERHGDVTLENLLREREFGWGAAMLECWRAVLGGRRDEAVSLFETVGEDGPARLKAIQAFLAECYFRHVLGGLPRGASISPALDCLTDESWAAILANWESSCHSHAVAVGDTMVGALNFWASVRADVPWQASFLKGYELLFCRTNRRQEGVDELPVSSA
jgi:DNA polymerase III gamma/tau subunit